MASPIRCAGVVLVEGEEILLIRRGHAPDAGRWSLPGGRALAGESPHETARREAFEETGLALAIGSALGTAELVGTAASYLVTNFAATRTAGAVPCAGSDAVDVRFVEFSELALLDLSGGLLEWLIAHGVVDRRVIEGRVDDGGPDRRLDGGALDHIVPHDA
jgi:8-oxo-dGTP diphosphatase